VRHFWPGLLGFALLLLCTPAANAALNLAGLSPAGGAVNVCYDTHLQITFDAAPSFTNSGRIVIYNSSGVPVDTNDLSLGITQTRKLGNPGGANYVLYPVLVNGNTATIYPHPGALTNGQTYYVNITQGLFTNKTSGAYAGITDSTTWSFTTRASQPVTGTNYLVVSADNTGDFATVQGAMDFIPSGNTQHVLVYIRDGIYREVDYENQRHNVTFRGQDRAQTIIAYPNNNNLNPGGSSVRTMIDINANDVAMENLTVSNSTPVGGSQAEALRVSGQRFIFNNANLDSFQDTFLINSAGHYAYIYNSHIQGDVDFVWDDGCVVFQSCQIEAMNPGYNCQMRTPSASFNGSDYLDCSLTKDHTFTGHYLARIDPNAYPFSATAYINCSMDTHISPAGWLLNNYTNNVSPTNNLRFWEYQSTDLNGNALNVSQRIAPSIQITATQAALMRNLTNVFGWLPQLAPNIIGQPTNLTAALGGNASFAVTATGIQTTNPATTGGASVILPLNYQWYKNQTNPIAGATSATFSLTNVGHTNTATYSVVVSNLTGVVTSSIATLTVTGDSPPVASPATYQRNAGYPLLISIASLSTDWSDPDHDTVTLASVNNSTNGATVTSDDTNIDYSDTNNVADQFNYTVSDGYGGSSIGIVNVTIAPGSTNITIAGETVNGDGSVTLNFSGVPGYTYWLEAATNLTPATDWEPVSTNEAGTNGVWQVIDPTAADVPQKFYRVMQP
jgi:pectin methylesterase-like acyl-CoA thioesterase